MGELFTLQRFKAMCNTVIVLITHLHYQCFVYAIFGTATIPGLRRISGQTVRLGLQSARCGPEGLPACRATGADGPSSVGAGGMGTDARKMDQE